MDAYRSEVNGVSADSKPMIRRRTSTLRMFFSRPLTAVGAVLIVAIVGFCFVGPLFYTTDQIHNHLSQVMEPPGGRFPLGTDDVGHDVLGRLMFGGRSSLIVGIAAALLASIVGTLWGAIAGFVGGPIDAVMMRVVDTFIAIPSILLMLMLASIFTPTIPVLIIALSIVSWLSTARLVRGDSLSLRAREFIQAVMGAGGRPSRIVLRHIVPNVAGVIVVQTTFEVANAILLLAGLSFLGLGPPSPATNWGSMLSDGLTYAYSGKWWLIYPAGAAIVLTVMAFNFLGDGLRDALEVRLQGS